MRQREVSLLIQATLLVPSATYYAGGTQKSLLLGQCLHEFSLTLCNLVTQTMSVCRRLDVSRITASVWSLLSMPQCQCSWNLPLALSNWQWLA